MMNAATLSLVFLIIFGVSATFCEGRIGGATERCLCQERNLIKRVKPALLKRCNVFPPSASCSYTDIIITMKKGRKLCLDPKGKQGMQVLSQQKLKKKAQEDKKQKKNKRQD